MVEEYVTLYIDHTTLCHIIYLSTLNVSLLLSMYPPPPCSSSVEFLDSLPYSGKFSLGFIDDVLREIRPSFKA